MAAVTGDGVGGGLTQPAKPFVPQTVAGKRDWSRGAGEPRDHERGEHMIMAGGGTFPGEKFFDLVDDAVDISGPDRVIPTGHLDKARPGNFLRELPSRSKLYAGGGGP